MLGGFGTASSIQPDGTAPGRKEFVGRTHMAPEEISGGAITVQTDLYYLGRVLFEILVGESAFAAAASNSAEWLMQILQDVPQRVRERVPECPAELDELIHHMLSKNPTDRPSDAATVRRQLGEIRDALKKS